MSTHCQLGDSPQFIYEFKDETPKIYKTHLAPIEVEETEVPKSFNGGQCPIHYMIKANLTNNAFGTYQINFNHWSFLGPITDVYLQFFYPFTENVMDSGTAVNYPSPGCMPTVDHHELKDGKLVPKTTWMFAVNV